MLQSMIVIIIEKYQHRNVLALPIAGVLGIQRYTKNKYCHLDIEDSYDIKKQIPKITNKLKSILSPAPASALKGFPIKQFRTDLLQDIPGKRKFCQSKMLFPNSGDRR